MSGAPRTDWFSARGSLQLRYREWRVDRPRARLLIVHGIGEHAGRYAEFAGVLGARGFSVHAFDQRGHGESPGPRVYSDSVDTWHDDLERFRAHALADAGDEAVFVLGHSMGGLQVASWLLRRRPEFRAAVLSSPALDMRLSPLQRAAVRVVARIAPRWRLPRAVDAAHLSHDPAITCAYRSDPLVEPRYSARLIADMLRESQQLLGRSGEVDLPTLVLHGGADPVCAPGASREFAASLRAPRSGCRVYPGLLHEILNETERERVTVDIVEWLEGFLERI